MENLDIFKWLKVNLQLNHLDIYFSFTLSLCLKKEKTKWLIQRLKIITKIKDYIHIHNDILSLGIQ